MATVASNKPPAPPTGRRSAVAAAAAAAVVGQGAGAVGRDVRIDVDVPLEAALRLRRLCEEGALARLGVVGVRLDGASPPSVFTAPPHNHQRQSQPPPPVQQQQQQHHHHHHHQHHHHQPQQQQQQQQQQQVQQFKSPNVICPPDNRLPPNHHHHLHQQQQQQQQQHQQQLQQHQQTTSQAATASAVVATNKFPFASMNQIKHTNNNRIANETSTFLASRLNVVGGVGGGGGALKNNGVGEQRPDVIAKGVVVSQTQSQPQPPPPPPPPYPLTNCLSVKNCLRNNHVAKTMTTVENNVINVMNKTPPVTISSPLLVNLLQNDGDTANIVGITNGATKKTLLMNGFKCPTTTNTTTSSNNNGEVPPPPYPFSQQTQTQAQPQAPLLDLIPQLTDLKSDDLDKILDLEMDDGNEPAGREREQDHEQATSEASDNRVMLINPLTGLLEPRTVSPPLSPPDDIFSDLPSPIETNLSDDETSSSLLHQDSLLLSAGSNGADCVGKDEDTTINKGGKLKLKLKLDKVVEELRVPPLHISLRGRNSAVIRPKGKRVRKKGGDETNAKRRRKSLQKEASSEANQITSNTTVSNTTTTTTTARSNNTSNSSSANSNNNSFPSAADQQHQQQQQQQHQQQQQQQPSLLTLNKDKQEDELKDLQVVVGSTNRGTIPNLPPTPKARKEKLDKAVNKPLLKEIKETGKEIKEHVVLPVLPTSGDLDMAAKFKQKLLEGEEQKGPVTNSTNREQKEEDKQQQQQQQQHQADDSGIESMDALSEKSPPNRKVPELLDIEAELAKMEGLHQSEIKEGTNEVTISSSVSVDVDNKQHHHHGQEEQKQEEKKLVSKKSLLEQLLIEIPEDKPTLNAGSNSNSNSPATRSQTRTRPRLEMTSSTTTTTTTATATTTAATTTTTTTTTSQKTKRKRTNEQSGEKKQKRDSDSDSDEPLIEKLRKGSGGGGGGGGNVGGSGNKLKKGNAVKKVVRRSVRAGGNSSEGRKTRSKVTEDGVAPVKRKTQK